MFEFFKNLFNKNNTKEELSKEEYDTNTDPYRTASQIDDYSDSIEPEMTEMHPGSKYIYNDDGTKILVIPPIERNE